MSENLNRSNQDFSKYDSMRIGELEEILRADAMGPERDDSDVDEILYAMEVLAKKRRQNGIAGKTALEAYQDFQQHYIPLVEEESAPKRKATIIPFRRIAAVAACFVLVFSFTTSANAFSFRDIWDLVVTWAQETFCLSVSEEVNEPSCNDEYTYSSLADALSKDGRDTKILPIWLPEGYELIDIIIDRNPVQESYLAIYENAGSRIKISVRLFLSTAPEQLEQSDNLTEIYSRNGVNYYIFENFDQLQAVWAIDSYECYISGVIDINDVKEMIDSIGKG